MATRCRIGENASIEHPSTVGHVHEDGASPAKIGKNATIRTGSIIYADVEIGDDLTTGHHAVIREQTRIGNAVTVGTLAVVDGRSRIGSNVSLQTGAYVPAQSTIGNNVFLGPSAVLTNDPYPARKENDLAGPRIEEGVTIGANATVLPDITISKHAFVAAGAIVTKDVPAETLAIGAPATIRELPEGIRRHNLL